MKNSQKGLISAGVIAAVVLGLSMTGAPDKGLSGGGKPEGAAAPAQETAAPEPAEENKEAVPEAEVPEKTQEEAPEAEAVEEETAAEEVKEEATMVQKDEEELLIRISAAKVEIGDAVIEYDAGQEEASAEAVRKALRENYKEGQTIIWDVSYGDDLVTEKVEAIAEEVAGQ